MQESQNQLKAAIIIVGESLNMKEATELYLHNVGVYSTIRELTYKMFIEDKQQYFEADDRVFEAVSLIRKYCREMSKNGEVNFDAPYVYQKN